MARGIDEIDRRIIVMLQADGRRPNVDIAEELGLAEGTVRKRLERLLKDGVLHITGIVEPAKVGLLTTVLITVQVDLARVDDVARQLAGLPEVQNVSVATGTWDIVLEAVFPTDAQLLAFLKERVSTIPGVRRTETSHILHRVKHVGNWELPLSLAPAVSDAVEPELLRRSDLFMDLDDEGLAALASIARLKTFEPGARIFSENDSAREVFVVERGRVAVLVDIGEGRQTVMGTIARHESLGWAALVSPYIHADTARCVERTTVVAIPAAGLRELFMKDCRTCYGIMEKTAALMSAHLRDARFKLTHLLQTGGTSE